MHTEVINAETGLAEQQSRCCQNYIRQNPFVFNSAQPVIKLLIQQGKIYGLIIDEYPEKEYLNNITPLDPEEAFFDIKISCI